MKFQNPSFKVLMNGRTNGRTDARTDKPKAICSPLFQSWGHKDYKAYLACKLLPIILKITDYRQNVHRNHHIIPRANAKLMSFQLFV